MNQYLEKELIIWLIKSLFKIFVIILIRITPDTKWNNTWYCKLKNENIQN